jgi:hypothetical protein
VSDSSKHNEHSGSIKAGNVLSKKVVIVFIGQPTNDCRLGLKALTAVCSVGLLGLPGESEA